jgi:hypothetical protein
MAAGIDHYHLSFPPKWQSYFDRNEVNLESYQLIWADRQLEEIEINEEELFSTLKKFRELVNHTKAFDHWRICFNYIQKKKADTFTFLVCSAAYAKDLVPKLCPFTEAKVWKVYVYCAEGDRHNQFEWLEDYNRVSKVWIHKGKCQYVFFFSKNGVQCTKDSILCWRP